MFFILGCDGYFGKVVEGWESRFGGDSFFGFEFLIIGYGVDNSCSWGSNIVWEGSFWEWGGGVNREFVFGGWGFSWEGNRDVGFNKNGGDGWLISRGWDGFDDWYGFGNWDLGFYRDVSFGWEGGLNRDNFFGRDYRCI